jgi:Ig-like domain from next to BRCA1 gene
VPALFSLAPGEHTVVTLTMQNTGGSTWGSVPDVQFRLGRVGDEPKEEHRMDLLPAEEIRPGGSKEFKVPMAAPTTTGDYAFQWRMLVEGAEWFGDPTPSAQVRVVAPRRPGPLASGAGPSS